MSIKKIILILNGTPKKSVRFNKIDKSQSNNAIPKQSSNSMISHTTVEPIIQMGPLFKFKEQTSLNYEKMKERLAPAVKCGDVKCTFNDQKCSFTFYHSPEEIKAIVCKYSLVDISDNVSLGSDSLTMNGQTFFQLGSKQPKTKDSLIEDSRRFFKTRKIQNIEIEQKDQSQDPKKMFETLLQKNEGICIGEMHHDEAPKKVLIENMSTLKNQGVTTLYLEHLHYNTTTQKLLDKYMKSKKEEMPGYLKELLASMDCGFDLYGKDGSFTSLVIAAKKAGIRIVAIDTAMSYSCGTDRKMGV